MGRYRHRPCADPSVALHRASQSDQVARPLRSYEGLATEQADLEALLVKLAPAWAELRRVLNELNRVLGD